MEEKTISQAVIARLPRYYRYLEELKKEGVERISSSDLSEKMHVTASQIRQDLNNFGGFGQQGYGYNIQYLHDGIGRILGLNTVHRMIIVGIGNIGRALAGYLTTEREGFELAGLFDANPELKGKSVSGFEIRMMEEIPSFVAEQKVEIAVLTIPKEHAKETADFLVENGIRAIWNFALIDLNLFVPRDVVVENVHLSESMMRLSYNLTDRKKEET